MTHVHRNHQNSPSFNDNFFNTNRQTSDQEVDTDHSMMLIFGPPIAIIGYGLITGVALAVISLLSQDPSIIAYMSLAIKVTMSATILLFAIALIHSAYQALKLIS